ncbi:MAG: GNAT family N-acetyltransferase [Gemmatimonadota bacterium]|nr:GNAT family N-acetyltransferase [Gemmatimonadota bacterium]
MEREDVENLIFSLAHARARSGEVEAGALFAVLERDTEVVGCVLRTPPHKVLVTDLPAAAAPIVVEALVQRFDRIPTVLGPEPAAEAVARAWAERCGGGWRRGMPQRIYRLDRVVPPTDVPGRLRRASAADVDLAVEWGKGFARDAGVQFATGRDAVERWVARGALFFWESDVGPVSMAAASGQTPHGARIGYVYTPPEHRRRGYAGACVAALSQRMLDSGLEFCVLYTDLGNPTSNAIYQRVGYQPIGDVRDFDVIPPEAMS